MFEGKENHPENIVDFITPEVYQKEQRDIQCDSAIEKKYKILENFKECLDALNLPLAFLTFGSIGRGKSYPESDIDCMVIFKDEDLEKFINNDFLNQLPFDTEEPATNYDGFHS